MGITKQVEISIDLGVKHTIDPEKEYIDRVHFMSEYLISSGARGFVVGVSGGQDSTLAGKIASDATIFLSLATGIPYTMLAVEIPYGESNPDILEAVSFISPTHFFSWNIKDSVDSMVNKYSELAKRNLSDYQKENLKARERMQALYLLAGEFKLLVVGANNASKSVTGYFTKYGDGAADIMPLWGLTKRQGRKIMEYIKATKSTYTNSSAGGLYDERPSLTDEEDLGLTYDQIDDFLELRGSLDSEVENKIIEMYENSSHKRAIPFAPPGHV